MRDNLLIRAKKHPYCAFREYKCKSMEEKTDTQGLTLLACKKLSHPYRKDLYKAIQFHFPKPQKKRNQTSAQNNSITPIDQLTTEAELSGHIHKKFVDYRALIMIQRPEY